MPGDTRNQAAEEAMVEAVARDLLPALQSGELSMEDFEQIVVKRLTFPERMREQRQRDSSAAEVDVPTEEIVAILGKGTTHDFGADVEFAATLEALNAVLSGPPSSPARRGRGRPARHPESTDHMNPHTRKQADAEGARVGRRRRRAGRREHHDDRHVSAISTAKPASARRKRRSSAFQPSRGRCVECESAAS